mmetsp:Transcript_14105/g.38846  ORF Transcript_14105/g.38846 Transcript_14105/m.38846 type:complete len:84 (+) Transcript_14105:62-313(+)
MLLNENEKRHRRHETRTHTRWILLLENSLSSNHVFVLHDLLTSVHPFIGPSYPCSYTLFTFLFAFAFIFTFTMIFAIGVYITS